MLWKFQQWRDSLSEIMIDSYLELNNFLKQWTQNWSIDSNNEKHFDFYT